MSALPCPVEYLVYQPGVELRLPPGKAYGYVLAGNGVFKIAHNRHFEACIPVSQCRVSGLAELKPYLWLDDKLPISALRAALSNARRAAQDAPREAMYHLKWVGRQVVVESPAQVGTAASLRYAGGDDPDIVMDLHSHCEIGAFFSQTDNRDEQGLRLYGVIGSIFTQPEIALRVGVYGDFWKVGVGDVFELGDRR